MSKDIVARVVARYAAADLDAKMKALLLKLRKGADASLSIPGLWKVLAFLGGWEVKKFVGLVKMHGYGGEKDDDPSLFAEENEQTARFGWERLKKDVVHSLPSNPELGREYVMDLEPFHGWEAAAGLKYFGGHYRHWRGAPGYRVTDPNGKTFELLPGKYNMSQGEKGLRIWDITPWLKKETTYLTQINGLLGMEPHEPGAIRTRDNTGTCGACFRNIKLVANSNGHPTMALHGYNRPGYGYVIGRCFGGAHPPYELSTEATKIMLESAKSRLAGIEKYLASLPNATEFNANLFTMGAKERIIQKAGNGLWVHDLEQHIKVTEGHVKAAHKEMSIYKWLIDHWEVRELPKEGGKHIDWFMKAVIAAGL